MKPSDLPTVYSTRVTTSMPLVKKSIVYKENARCSERDDRFRVIPPKTADECASFISMYPDFCPSQTFMHAPGESRSCRCCSSKTDDHEYDDDWTIYRIE